MYTFTGDILNKRAPGDCFQSAGRRFSLHAIFKKALITSSIVSIVFHHSLMGRETVFFKSYFEN